MYLQILMYLLAQDTFQDNILMSEETKTMLDMFWFR